METKLSNWKIDLDYYPGALVVRIFKNGDQIFSGPDAAPPYWSGYPNFIERFFGITFESKVRKAILRAHKFIRQQKKIETEAYTVYKNLKKMAAIGDVL